MDLSAITGLAQSISLTKTLVKAASEIRDFNAMAEIVSKLNAQILDTQERLFALQSSLMLAQQESFEAEKTIRELREALAEKERYTYFELRPGAWVYRREITPEERATRQPGSPEPEHYFCQNCFAKGLKISFVFRRWNQFGRPDWCCPNCEGMIFLD
ncbi:MAG: hypothetical protein FWD62_01670 [Betaproteobacteria bacterium]|nr:hypothetical protein [Betaproteobacteria bacterium]